MRSFAATLLATCLAACHVADDPFEAMPRRSLEDLRATLPDPSPERAFVFEGDVEQARSASKGRYRLSVEPGIWNGSPAWLVVEESDAPLFPDPTGFERAPERETQTWWLSRDLRVLKGDAPDEDGARTTGGALLLLRNCPAEVAAYGEPPDCLYVATVAKDGSITGSAPLRDMWALHVKLQGKARTPVELVRRLGRRQMGRITARPARP